MLLEHSNYRVFLKTTLIERIQRNSSYSLRSFAKSIGLAPSTLTEVLQGKKNISYERAVKIAHNLQFSESESEYFCLLTQLESAKSLELKSIIQSKLASLSKCFNKADVSLDQFKLIADWYHLPILALSELDGFDLTPKNIAEKLSISAIEAENALERLIRMDLLVQNKAGKFISSHGSFFTETPLANESLKKYHEQTLKLAIEALDRDIPNEKIIATENISIDTDDIKQYSQAIDKFLSHVNEIRSKSKKKNDAYHLGIQFFSLTKRKGNS